MVDRAYPPGRGPEPEPKPCHRVPPDEEPFLRAEGVGEAAAHAVEDRFQVGPEGEAPQGVVGDRATKTPVRVSPRVVQELAVVARVAALALALEARLLVLIRVALEGVRVFGLDLWGKRSVNRES